MTTLESATLPTAERANEQAGLNYVQQLQYELYDRDSDVSRVLHTVIGQEATPLRRNRFMPLGGNTLFLKDETVHRSQAYKIRGATVAVYHELQHNPSLERVVCASAGNHAKGVNEAAACFGLQTSVHMSRFASQKKTTDLQDQANVKVYNGYDNLAEAQTGALREVESDPARSALIHPFDNLNVIAGQGTLLQELLDQLVLNGYDLLHDRIDVMLPGGGKGMAAGCLAWADHLVSTSAIGPNVRFHVVEIEDKEQNTWCDGTNTTDGQVTNQLLGQVQVPFDYVRVNSVMVAKAMRQLTQELGKPVEPAGALATAGVQALVESTDRSSRSTYVAVVSGANVDQKTLSEASKLLREAEKAATKLALSRPLGRAATVQTSQEAKRRRSVLDSPVPRTVVKTTPGNA